MLNEQDIKKLKEILATKDDIKGIEDDLKKFATKKDLKNEVDNLAVMINRSFNKTEERMADGFKLVNEKLDKKVENTDKRMSRIEDALAIK